MREYDPCVRCRSGFSPEICSQFCTLYKMLNEREIEMKLAAADYDRDTKRLHERCRRRR